jgi:hypothetical protein
MAWPVGVNAASPTPTPILATNTWRNERARPQPMVITPQIATPTEITSLRDQRSAALPMGTPMTEYKTANARPVSRLTWVSEICRSCFTGSINRARIDLSMKLNM